MKNIARTLFCVARDVFENATFSLVEPVECEHSPQQDDPGVSLEFRGPCSGVIRMLAPDALATLVASNMLGEDEEAPLVASNRYDALGEILNMICGRLLPLLFGSHAEFRLGRPQQVSLASPISYDGAHYVKSLIDVEGSRVLLEVFMAKEPVRGMPS